MEYSPAVAGRRVSNDRQANSAARVQASTMGMGQAAAVTAVLAAKLNVTPGAVPLDIEPVISFTTS